MSKVLNIGIEKSTEKIKHYCAYQERSHQEVKDKLYSFGLYPEQVDAIISELITENFLNEERYAIAFSRGKFNIKNWGKQKIKYELKKNRVSDYCIKIGLSTIDEDDYQKKLEKLLIAKSNTLRSEKNIFIKKKKIQSFLMQKGYETSLINDLLQKL